MPGADLSVGVAFDSNSLNQLKQAAREQSPEAIKGVAKQFEAIFMNMMLKSMREATPQDSMFDNDQTRTFTSMLDQQLTNNLAAKGLGLADVLARQLTKGSYDISGNLAQAVSNAPPDNSPPASSGTSLTDNPFLNHILSGTQKNPTSNHAANGASIKLKTLNDGTTNNNPTVADFKDRMTPHAEIASQATGIPSHLMLGQAALESGWGRRELKGIDGTNSYNLFGIKATGSWNGKTVDAMTTEYINGIKQKRIEKFRAYDSYADSFKDFANLMRNNPRYQNVLENLNNANNYAQAMQKAGYATDPDYAIKLASVIDKLAPDL
ncbi:MAG: flagellar assembly peptidoglycan hydrolase FlgJ [Betaproteobacteria bacterium HGW-Betaproteobacteria-22]|nr:MAG: flagellar assembly peptidoglycan hydrolase FlgJ [Betaproteobacteria bacterium HGW-Betaproteobacteria-22]